MHDETRSPSGDGGAEATSVDSASSIEAAVADAPGKKKKKKKDRKPLEAREVYEAGGIIVCDGKVVMRLTDKQRWIFPKGKLKKHESPGDAALREATEETGLSVEMVDQVADLLIPHEGKKRRFVFFLMRAVAKTWDWPHHEGRDTFLISPERVGDLLRHKEYARVWDGAMARVLAMVDEPTPFVARAEAPAEA